LSPARRHRARSEIFKSRPIYWEGAATVSGGATGRAYVELTGYCETDLQANRWFRGIIVVVSARLERPEFDRYGWPLDLRALINPEAAVLAEEVSRDAPAALRRRATARRRAGQVVRRMTRSGSSCSCR
jgi:hypothetical protein